MAEQRFYDRQYKKFGAYSTGIQKRLCTSEYPTKDPEAVFKETLINLSDVSRTALDMGCGDGKFTVSLSGFYQQVTGVESSDLFLSAMKLKEQSREANITFERQDASHTSFADASFDVVYSRRGPNPHKEIKRLLKLGGTFVFITIGELDARHIKEVFGRGQGFGETSRVKEVSIMGLEVEGFRIDFAEDYLYAEYYFSIDALDRFLQGVPIFEDYETEKDRHLLLDYARHSNSDKGIYLPRHRVVIAATKIEA